MDYHIFFGFQELTLSNTFVGLVGTASPSMGSLGDQGTRPLKNLQYLA